MTNKNKESLERTILVVDDLLGRKDDPMFPETYGNGRVQGYKFELEDAFDKAKKKYSAEKVLKRVRELKPVAILLDMNYGNCYSENQRFGYGLKIMSELSRKMPQIPVLIHSSPEGNSGKTLIERCIIKYGAKESIEKCPSTIKMKTFLDKYTGDSK